ncbi:PAS domain S-box protein, partial [uncultured Marinobacter sp.]|uniref:PAS domain-containing protein n=1 Tax=uncultured Marinobacter sp. TaxID=187379 RepID=UPI0030DBBB09
MSNLKGLDKAVRRSLWLALTYFLVGGLWITFSDGLAVMLIGRPDVLHSVQTWKGWGFVAVTALALFFILRQQFRKDQERLRLQQDQQEEILQLSQFQKSVIDNASIWINALDPSGRILLWNKAAEAITGYSADEVIGGDDIWLWLYPNASYREEVRAAVASALAGTSDIEGFETRILTRHLGERLIQWNTRQLTNSAGEQVGSLAIGMDITEQRQAQRGLRDRERQLATLMDSLPGMAYRCLYDEHWTMKFVSSGCMDLTGYGPDEILDNRCVSWARLIASEQPEYLTEQVEIAIAAAETFSLEYQLRRK